MPTPKADDLFKKLKAIDDKLFIVGGPNDDVWAANSFVMWRVDRESGMLRTDDMLHTYNLPTDTRGNFDLDGPTLLFRPSNQPPAVETIVKTMAEATTLNIEPMERGGMSFHVRSYRTRPLYDLWEGESHVVLMDPRMVELIETMVGDPKGSWVQIKGVNMSRQTCGYRVGGPRAGVLAMLAPCATSGDMLGARQKLVEWADTI